MKYTLENRYIKPGEHKLSKNFGVTPKFQTEDAELCSDL
jgi:hypothetical protein